MRTFLSCAALAVVLTGARAQDTQPGTRPATETRPDEFVYQVPFEGITLEQLAHDAEVATGRTFILSEKNPLRGKLIRFAGVARVPRDQAFSLFQAFFVTQGYALKPLGGPISRILVVESIDTAVDLKQRAIFVTPDEIDQYRNEVGTVVMTFFPLRYVRLQNVRAALSQILTSKAVEVTLDVESANSMIVIGFAPTVYAMKQIIAVMDVPQLEAEERFDLITLIHAVAEEIEPIIQNLIESNHAGGQQAPGGRGGQPAGAPGAKPAPRIVSDPRLNALAVFGVQSDLDEIRRLVATLDTEVTEPAQNLHIYRLLHTNADDVADLLAESYGFARSGTRGGGDAKSSTPAGAGNAPGTAGGAARSDGSAGGRGGGAHGGGNGDVQVVAEPHNNALIVRASRSRYEELLPLIRELDRKRAQVLIRGVVAELTQTQFKQVGAEIAALAGGNSLYHPGALTGFGLSTVRITEGGINPGSGAGSGSGSGGGAGGGSVSTMGDPNLIRIPVFPGTTPNSGGGVFGLFNDNLNVPLLVSLLQNGRRGNLVSTPVVLATDNSQSTIETKVSVAITTVQQQAVPPATSRPTVQPPNQTSFGGYQEAKMSMTISPHISSDNYVRLELELLVEAFLPRTDSRPLLPPDKASRKFVGAVTMRDGETVVIGGITHDQSNDDLAGVPPLAEAPFIGPLFSLRTKDCERTTIYFFLCPTIIKTFDTLDQVSYERKLDMLKLQGPVRLIDPNFHPILLDNRRVGIECIEASGNLDMPRYCSIVPLVECGPGNRGPEPGAGFR